jgi:peptidoglycan/LPS O-acetylase OafA/YrhL
MSTFIVADKYRKDIDGLRAIAVITVILFHLGYLPNGYLGVDIFFAISGYLITKIVYSEAVNNRFSIANFYLRRIRRIIPLVLFTTTIVLIIGVFVMLPDDLENLSQSVFATNLFANNILLLITTRNYWDLVNDYKPLMHTWSLGVEEQFYLAYPIIFLLLKGKSSRWILPVLIILTVFSLILFISSSNEAFKFYSIQFRFFELSLGGLGAIILKDKLLITRFRIVFLSIVLLILFFNINVSSSVKLFLIVIASIGVLISANNQNKLVSIFLENKMMIGIGKISFSLYIWHQIILAYTRYFILVKITFIDSVIIFIILVVLSILTFHFIEQPFRNKKKISTQFLLLASSLVFAIICSSSLYIYTIKGITRDVPELEIEKNKIYEGNVHIKYNERIYELNKGFTTNAKIKVLVIGNSYARDWANILLESKKGKDLEISYVYTIKNCTDLDKRLNTAKYIFVSEMTIKQLDDLKTKIDIDTSKVWNVGTKNFGSNNGLFYNRISGENYFFQRTKLDPGFLEKNFELKKQWHAKYIDLIGMIIDKEDKIPVFTPDHKFISQDCRHLTHSGAVYFAHLWDSNQTFILE